MEIESNSTDCFQCHAPLVWMSRSRRLLHGRDAYEFDFRCNSCSREYRFTDGKLNELKIERDTVAERMAMRQAEIDAIRNRRCPNCGGPLDEWLRCDWCHERFAVGNGELVPRTPEPLKHKPQMSDFYVLNEQR